MTSDEIIFFFGGREGVINKKNITSFERKRSAARGRTFDTVSLISGIALAPVISGW